MRTIDIIPIRRPKGKVRIQLGPKPQPDDGWKDRAAWLLDALGARWARSSGYTLSPARAEAFARLYRAGWTVDHKVAACNRTPYHFYPPGDTTPHTLKQALNRTPSAHKHL